MVFKICSFSLVKLQSNTSCYLVILCGTVVYTTKWFAKAVHSTSNLRHSTSHYLVTPCGTVHKQNGMVHITLLIPRRIAGNYIRLPDNSVWNFAFTRRNGAPNPRIPRRILEQYIRLPGKFRVKLCIHKSEWCTKPCSFHIESWNSA